ncbi:hypothetical protein NE237_017630 [Protea cynaroides]|uniref:Retrotransposon gag domain-containing protein n=1 Tax=Protea cynaroides TaxID=273540 RepID=A0A9Q0K8F6_9MAGN|nr:hypothetical protein NE237_017630 [Protea cynaroides]
MISSFHMDGKALQWYQRMHRNGEFVSWEAFTKALEIRFGPSEFDDHQGALSKLTQTASVQDYQSQFEALANHTTNISSSFLISCFISGLRPDIRSEVLAFRPATMSQTIALARLQEAKIGERRRYNGRPTDSYGYRSSELPIPKTPLISTPPTTVPTVPPRIPVKRLSTAEMQQRRECGLCYNCDDKLSPGHRCKNRQFFLLDVELDETSIELPDSAPLPYDAEIEETHIHSEISYNALAGQSSLHTLRLHGTIIGSQVNILVDSGSTHNFIQTEVAHHLGLTVATSPQISVLVGNGDRLISNGFISELPVVIQGHTIKVDVFLLPIHGAELVLGVQWFLQLGPVVLDYKNLTLQFQHHDAQVTFAGVSNSTPTPMGFQALRCLTETNSIAAFFQLEFQSYSHDPPTIESGQQQNGTELEQLRKKFSSVFATPTALPPNRTFDHVIHLQPGTALVNVMPYRYPHFQKNEIERLVHEMLHSGVIQPSTSPFSSRILLVKKKMGLGDSVLITKH